MAKKMAQLLNFNPDSLSAILSHKGGYALVPTEAIKAFYESLRGIGPDLYVVAHFSRSEEETPPTVLMRGWVPPLPGYKNGDIETLQQKQTLLLEYLTATVQSGEVTAALKRPSDIYQRQIQHGYNLVFLCCKDGYIGCGWYDHAHTPQKGGRLAAFLLYALGLLNADQDPVLWSAAYRYLPYDSSLGSVEDADKALYLSLYQLAAAHDSQ